MLKVPVKSEVNGLEVVYDVLDKTPFEVFLTALGMHYIYDKLPYVTTTLSLLADKEDVRKLEIGLICTYVQDHYKEVLEAATRDFAKRTKKQEDKGK